MKRTTIALLLAAMMGACVADGAGGAGGGDGSGSGGKADRDGLEPVYIGEEDDGATVRIPEGSDVVVKLPANPTTGYDWEVVSTNRTFGYPKSTEYEPDGDATGSGGTTILTWATGGFVRAGGSHTVELAYKRSWEDTFERTFTFTVEIVAPDAPLDPDPTGEMVTIDETGNGETFDVPEGADVLVKLPSNPSTGYDWRVAATDRTFGYPESTDFEPSSEAIGSGGHTLMLWKTGGFVRAGYEHTVRLEYARASDDDVADTFEFTVAIY